MEARRCLVVADGYYEWQGETPNKQPWWIRLNSGEPFGFAGLWESWKSPEGETIETTIVTTEPNELMAQIHDRMLVILAPDDHDAWLAPDAPADRLKALLRPYPAKATTAHKASRAVNNARNDSAALIEAVP